MKSKSTYNINCYSVGINERNIKIKNIESKVRAHKSDY